MSNTDIRLLTINADDGNSNPSPEMRVVVPVLLEKLLGAVENLVLQIASVPPTGTESKKVTQIIETLNLGPTKLVSKFTKQLRARRR